MKIFAKTIQTLVIGVLIVASLLLIFTQVNFLGFQMFSVQSGSMEPELKTGAIVFNLKFPGYRTGDIITFQKQGTNITHRIVGVSKGDQGIEYTVKGDANDSADLDQVAKNQVSGRVLFSIPYLGYFAGFLRTLPGLILFIIIPSTIIVYEEINNITKETKKIIRKKKGTKEKVHAT
jgi:signal peptidase I